MKMVLFLVVLTALSAIGFLEPALSSSCRATDRSGVCGFIAALR